MPYTPSASFNYTPMTLQQAIAARPAPGTRNPATYAPVTAQQTQVWDSPVGNQGMDFARWAAGQGIDLANLLRTDRNTQQAIQNQFQRDQFNAAQQQQSFQNQFVTNQQRQAELQAQLERDAALRNENWSRNLSNPAVSGAVQNNVAGAFANAAPMLADIEQRYLTNQVTTEPYYGLSTRRNLYNYGLSGAGGMLNAALGNPGRNRGARPG